MDRSRLNEADANKTRIKIEHIADLKARVGMIQHYLSAAQNAEMESNRTHYAALWINEGWEYCMQNQIALDKPEELRKNAALVERLVKMRNSMVEKQQLFSQVAEALQESLTFFLGKEYGFDPMKERFQLDLDHLLLIKVTEGENSDNTVPGG